MVAAAVAAASSLAAPGVTPLQERRAVGSLLLGLLQRLLELWHLLWFVIVGLVGQPHVLRSAATAGSAPSEQSQAVAAAFAGIIADDCTAGLEVGDLGCDLASSSSAGVATGIASEGIKAAREAEEEEAEDEHLMDDPALATVAARAVADTKMAVVPAAAAPTWRPGDLVERLLDDVSDIWAGAMVMGSSAGGLFSVRYEDNGSVEEEVEGQELRTRKMRLNLPVEAWVYIGGCLFEKTDLCAFETITPGAREAQRWRGQGWWCIAYHERFGRCGPRCSFERVTARERCCSGQATAQIVRACGKEAELGLTAADRKPWKERYAEQERLSNPGMLDTGSPKSAPGDAAYAEMGLPASGGYSSSGRKVVYGDALAGWFFDPRLGRMVREC